MKNIFLLGATGSVGRQVLEVIRGKRDFKIKSISFNRNIDRARDIILEFAPEFVAAGDNKSAEMLKEEFPDVRFDYGAEGLVRAAEYSDEDGYLVNAVVGAAGLKPTIAAIKKGRDVLLANKETLVMAGFIVKRMIRKYNVRLLPIDSEHSAIFQCLKSGRNKEVSRLIITASGGSLRNYSRSELKHVGLPEVLTHPNWEMGKKITVDSATMANKGLEVIEAHYLFDIDYEFIETVIHPESVIHSMVEFHDKNIIAQLAYPDMRLPIQYALYYPLRVKNDYPGLSFESIKKLSFQPMDYERFPLIKAAYKAGRAGGIMPAVYNAANEAAVSLFLAGKITFTDIETIILTEIENAKNIDNPTLEDILYADESVKNKILMR